MNDFFTNARVYLLLVLCIINGSAVLGQRPLQRHVSFQARKKPVSEVLKEISLAGKFYFSYNSEIVHGDSLVSLQIAARPVGEVLNTLFGNRYQYKERGEYIIIQPAPKERSIVISGRITDSEGGTPVDFASVYSRVWIVSDVTNDEGNFKLRVRDASFPVQLNISKVGYADTTIVVGLRDAANVNISISQRAIDLDPVYVKYSEGSWLSRFFVSRRLRAQSRNIGQFFVSLPYQASLTPGLGTHGRMSTQVVNKFSLNLLGGYTAGVNGLELAGGFNISKTDVRYAQIAGVFNQVVGKVDGVQMAGLLNHVRDTLTGVQVSGFSGVARKGMVGVQLSGAANLSGAFARGVQVAGAINVANEGKGVQMAGAVNHARVFSGVQVSGVLNAARQMRGVQFGVVNSTRRLKGVQIGVVNIADSSSGASFGLINIVRHGNSSFAVYSDEVAPFNVAWKMGNKYFYTMLTAGASVSDRNKVYVFGFGIGREFRTEKRIGFAVEASTQNLYLGSEDTPFLARFQTHVIYNITKKIGLYAGPSYSFFSNLQSNAGGEYKSFPLKQYPLSVSQDDLSSWLGWQAGIRWRYNKR